MMCRRWFIAAGAFALLAFVGNQSLQAQVNPNGYIQGEGFNYLFLDNPGGSNPGADETELDPGFWLAPHDIGAEDPKPGDDWNDIDFAASLAAGPKDPAVLGTQWVSSAALGALDPPVAIRGGADEVDLNGILDDLGVGNDNVLSVCTTYVNNTTGGDLLVRIATGSDDGQITLVNNIAVSRFRGGRGVGNPWNELGVSILPAGVSKLTVLVWEGGGGHGLRLGILSGGQLLADGNGQIEFLGAGAPDTVGQAQDEAAVAAAIAAAIGAPEDQINPNGWIRTKAWNMLFPLVNPFGCGGGGAANMATNWVAPHDITTEDPKGVTQWPDVDFGGAATAGGYDNGGILGAVGIPGNVPIWLTSDLVNQQFAPQFAAVALSLDGNDDLVDYQNMAEIMNWALAGVNAGTRFPDDPAPTPVEGATAMPFDNVLGMATTYVENTTDAPLAVDICTSSDDSIAVYVNCQLVTTVSACRGSGNRCDETRSAVLVPGVNKIAALDFEGGGGWNFRLQVKPAGGLAPYLPGDADVNFLGVGAAGTTTPDQLCLSRSTDGQFGFSAPEPPDSTVTVTVAGNGIAGDGGDLTETIGGTLDAIDVGNVTNGGSVVRDQLTDVYVNTSTTGHDLWQGCDDIEFDYEEVTGDFDFSVEILSYSHSTGAGRWGKFGPTARFDLNRDSLFHMMQAHGPSTSDGAHATVRRTHAGGDNCDDTSEAAQVGGVPIPAFLRIKRVGAVTTVYYSETAPADPQNDADWAGGGAFHTVDWGADIPDTVNVGFANSEHESNGASIQTLVYRILPGSTPAALSQSALVGNDAGGGSNSFFGNVTTDLSVQWTGLTADDLNAGVSYEVTGPEAGAAANISGAIAGGVSVAPGTTALSWAGTGPVGIFENAIDITARDAGTTTFDPATETYSVTGSGRDIWDGGDETHYVFQRVTGDFTFTARLAGIDDSNLNNTRWGRYGPMARYTADRNSKYSMANQPYQSGKPDDQQDTPRHQSRRDHLNNGNTQSDQVSPVGALSSQKAGWFKLIRHGKVFTSLFADDVDGAPGPFTVAGSDTHPNPPDTVLAGFAVSSHDDRTLTVDFDNVSIVPSSIEAPAASAVEADRVSINYDDQGEGEAPAGAVVVNGGGTVAQPGCQAVDGGTEVCDNGIDDDGDTLVDCDDVDDCVALPDLPNPCSPAVTADGRLQILCETEGGDANAVYYGADGAGLGDTGLTAEFDIWVARSDVPAQTPADGSTFAIFEGSIADAAGLIGGGGGAMGFQVGGRDDIPVSRHKSIAVEIDQWDGGNGTNDPPGANGANSTPDDRQGWHMGLDVNQTVVSSQNNVQFGAAVPPLMNDPDGVHVKVNYMPLDDELSLVKAWVTPNSGGDTVMVLNCLAPKLDGDVFLGFTAATGGATEDVFVDNVSAAPLCLEAADSVAISGDSEAPKGEAAALAAAFSGADGAVTYAWSVTDGPGSISGAADQDTASVQCDGVGTVTVALSAGDGVCEDLAEASWSVECLSVGVGLVPGDSNADGAVDISDGIRLLEKLFTNAAAEVPCDGAFNEGGNLQVLDWNGDGAIDLSDAVSTFTWLFLDNSPEKAHVLGTACLAIDPCERAGKDPVDVCTP